MKNQYFITMLFIAFSSLVSHGQQTFINLVTSNREPKPNTNVAEKSTTNSVSSGFNGYYSNRTDLTEGSTKSSNHKKMFGLYSFKSPIDPNR